MYPQVSIKHSIGNTLTIPNQMDIRVSSYTSDNTLVGVTSVPVDNAIDFGTNTLLLISTVGAENAEITTSSAHTDFTITTLTTLMPHNRGEAVSEIKYNQIVIHKSSTIDGTYTTFATQTFNVTQPNTVIYDPTGLKTDFYKVQWRNSISGDVSTLSDPISTSTDSPESAQAIIDSVRSSFGVSPTDKNITTEFLISSLNDAREYVNMELYGIRMDWQQEFEYPIRLLAGNNYVNLPDIIEYSDNDRSLLAVRFIVDNIFSPYNLVYIDKRSWNNLSYNLIGGTTTAAVLSGATTLQLDTTGDLPINGGVAYVATENSTQQILQIAYTANDRSTNTLSGVTGITRNISKGVQVWGRPALQTPARYTVYNDKLVFDSVIPQNMQGNNVFIDFYKKVSQITSLSDALPETYRNIYKSYLKWAIKYRKDNALPSNDPDLVRFKQAVEDIKNNLYTGQSTIIITS